MTLIRRKEFGEITVEFYGEGRASLLKGEVCETYVQAADGDLVFDTTTDTASDLWSELTPEERRETTRIAREYLPSA
jgi:hypothetical protein